MDWSKEQRKISITEQSRPPAYGFGTFIERDVILDESNGWLTEDGALVFFAVQVGKAWERTAYFWFTLILLFMDLTLNLVFLSLVWCVQVRA